MTPALLSDSTVAFIQREVAIDVASCSSDLRPSACRGFACRVSPDRQRLTLFVRRGEASQLLQDVLGRDIIAVVFCLPETEAAIQIKGRQISLSAAHADDIAHIDRYRHAFVDGIMRLGYDREFGLHHMATEPGQMVALSFTPEWIFEQTPGPMAGKRMGNPQA
ncbi:MAG TPA: hypothetical protein VFW93_12300 [Aquabacterium sp.]|uniref:hypothetical protein n=1 Tax=Aquabacterium sp. TaxID=1872578 RepID=UPI002E35863A|nr:hypothetical protein [Aquabacterium sp.]HEX5356996.1 hypothetical protein [Aquabacterium sp.]